MDKWSLIAASDVYNLSGTRACNKESAPPLPSPQTPPDKHNTVNLLLANPHQIKSLEAYPGIGGSDPIDKVMNDREWWLVDWQCSSEASEEKRKRERKPFF